jgi:DNA-binding MarR family transcriptional regulator
VGELCDHLDRAQSVVSDIVAHLEDKGLVERQDDPDDRRRRLVWLSPIGRNFLQRDQEILSVDLLRSAVATMAPADRAALARGMQALLAADDVLAADDAVSERPALPTHRKPPREDGV